LLLLAALVGCGTTFPGDWGLEGSAGIGVANAGFGAATSGAPASAGVHGRAGTSAMRAGAGAVGGVGPGRSGSGGTGSTAGQGARPRDLDADGFSANDCNDLDPKIFPGAPERCCDGVDSNCDGQDGDARCSCIMTIDLDADGYPSNVMGPTWDCDDRDPAIHPFTKELCGDGRDNDCNGVADRQDKVCAASSANGKDEDGDGYTILIDCNDFDPRVHPGAGEVCGDGVDNDCDGVVDPCAGFVDTDADGFPQIKDCNDWDPFIYPGNPDETCCDAIDSNCDGSDDPLGVMCNCFDADGDGYVVGPVVSTLADCNDQDRSIHPGAPEICTDNIDNDCDRRIDANDNECRILVD
jgi:hypothetical protein